MSGETLQQSIEKRVHDHIELIRAHAENTLQRSPQDVPSHDRLFLIAEIDRLRAHCLDLESQITGNANARTPAT